MSWKVNLMKSFFKVFAISFLCFTLILVGGVMAILKIADARDESGDLGEDSITVLPEPDGPKEKEKTELEKLVEKSKRINVLLLGLESTRTDTIILASFDRKGKSLDLISIPRDTYYHIKGYDRADEKKVNAIYGRSKSKGGGAHGTMRVAANILKVPIHHYVTLSYDGVENIIDSLDGVKVNIPFDMDYNDPYSNPPLSIKLKKGTRVLKGKEAVGFLRFRKNNDGSHSDGDIGRIKRQQEFIKAAAKKALSYRLPSVARTAFKFIKTDIDLDEIIYYSKSAIGISTEDISTYQLPGKPKGMSYYIYDSHMVEDMMVDIYKKGLED